MQHNNDEAISLYLKAATQPWSAEAGVSWNMDSAMIDKALHLLSDKPDVDKGQCESLIDLILRPVPLNVIVSSDCLKRVIDFASQKGCSPEKVRKLKHLLPQMYNAAHQ